MGMKLGSGNRFEGGKCREFQKISIGDNNAFCGGGYMLWPLSEGAFAMRIKIGDNNFFNRNFHADACGLIEIGNGCMFGPDVYITDSNHHFKSGKSSRDLPMNRGTISIGNNCWIGAKAIILKDVTLGDNCVVAAGAVVTKSFAAGSIIGGVPATLLKQISVEA